MDRLKPVDVRNVAFGKPPAGRRGYDETEVDQFLDLVERTLSQLYHEIALLRGEPTTPGGHSGLQLALPSGPTAGLGGGLGGPAGPGPGEEAILAELDQIKVRLARIESAVTRPAPEYGRTF
jgi:DivIVA domain-containing protein